MEAPCQWRAQRQDLTGGEGCLRLGWARFPCWGGAEEDSGLGVLRTSGLAGSAVTGGAQSSDLSCSPGPWEPSEPSSPPFCCPYWLWWACLA